LADDDPARIRSMDGAQRGGVDAVDDMVAGANDLCTSCGCESALQSAREAYGGCVSACGDIGSGAIGWCCLPEEQCLGALDAGSTFAAPVLELVVGLSACCAGPFLFPLVFLFPASPGGADGEPLPDSGWAVSMVQAPSRKPCHCLFTCVCPCAAQYFVRKEVLGGEIQRRYKLFQGRHDGPHCCATISPSLPFTIEAGTHGEDRCPHACLCLEVWLCSVCAFYASRDLMRDERGLGLDPTEVRVHHCLVFFGHLAQLCCCVGCWLQCLGCCIRLSGTDNDLAQTCGDESSRAGASCMRVAHAIRRGMWHVRNVAIACMSAQMCYEAGVGVDPGASARASKRKMPLQQEDRGERGTGAAWPFPRQAQGADVAGPRPPQPPSALRMGRRSGPEASGANSHVAGDESRASCFQPHAPSAAGLPMPLYAPHYGAQQQQPAGDVLARGTGAEPAHSHHAHDAGLLQLPTPPPGLPTWTSSADSHTASCDTDGAVPSQPALPSNHHEHPHSGAGGGAASQVSDGDDDERQAAAGRVTVTGSAAVVARYV